MIVLLKLLIAHLLGDFILQPDSWVVKKEAKKLRAWQLYVHALLHGLLAWLLVFSSGFAVWALIVAAVHFAIDGLKLVYQTDSTRRSWFFVDQFLHLVTTAAIWLAYARPEIPLHHLYNGQFWLAITLVLLLCNPCSYAIKIFISKWSPAKGDTIDESLQSAGKYIGIFERLFVFAFVVSGYLGGIAFLITAKSVFRFGDLKEAKDRKLTEYVLIGTLLSFGLAMLAGTLFVALKNH